MKTAAMRWISACFAVVGVAAGCGERVDTAGDDFDARLSAIVSGNNLSAADAQKVGLVAIYHPHSPEFPAFFPRPCSGTIIRSILPRGPGGYSSVVLTARHCVTVDASVDGTPAAPSALRLLPGANPGIANPDPPAAALAATSVVANFRGDIALVIVSVDWSAIASNQLGLYVGSAESLVGTSMTAYGYGINVLDGQCGTDYSTSGAGIGRSGGPFPITQGFHWIDTLQPVGYYYTNSNSAGQSTICGDSGGPDQITVAGDSAGISRTILGVHSTGIGSPAESDMVEYPLQDYVKLNLSPLGIGSTVNPQKNLSTYPTGQLSFVAARSYLQATAGYDSPTHRLIFNNPSLMCMGVTNGVPVGKTCDSNDTSQTWSFGPTLQLRNDQSNKCLTAVSDTSVTLTTCSSSSSTRNQQWKFHADTAGI